MNYRELLLIIITNRYTRYYTSIKTSFVSNPITRENGFPPYHTRAHHITGYIFSIRKRVVINLRPGAVIVAIFLRQSRVPKK